MSFIQKKCRSYICRGKSIAFSYKWVYSEGVADKLQFIQGGDRIRGSVDFDSKVALSDATLVQKIALNIVKPSNLQEYLADYNQDGVVNLKYSKAVLDAAVGIN